MGAICKPNCVTSLPNFGAINDCDITAMLASGEIANIIFIKCNETFTDVNDATEWTAKKTANSISIPFAGNGSIKEKSESGEVRIKCQTVSTICKKPFEFTSYIADNTAQTDYVLYNQLQKQRLGLSIMFLTCDGILLISPDWTTGKIAGLKPTTLKIDQVFSGEADSKMHYKINGEVEECRAFKRMAISQAVLDVING